MQRSNVAARCVLSSWSFALEMDHVQANAASNFALLCSFRIVAGREMKQGKIGEVAGVDKVGSKNHGG